MSLNYGKHIKRAMAAGGFGVGMHGVETDVIDEDANITASGGLELKDGTIHLPELAEALTEGPEEGIILFFDGDLKYIDEDDTVHTVDVTT